MKFILTSELGRLCKWLRILGYDAYYFKGSKSSLIMKALQEGRIIITRRRRITEENSTRKVALKSEILTQQLQELEEKLKIHLDVNNIFSRCTQCNAEIERIEKDKVEGKVPEYVYQTQEDFFRCPKCKRIFWRGTHWELAKKYFGRIRNDNC